MRWFYRAIGGGAWPVMQSHVSWCSKEMRVSLLRQKQYYVVWDDGEPKCEIMVASSVWEGAALWFDVSLLITTTGPVRVGCVPPAVLHCYLVLDTSTRLLYVPHVGDRKYRIHERASTEEYKTRLGFLLLRAIHRYKPRLKKARAGLFQRGRQGSLA